MASRYLGTGRGPVVVHLRVVFAENQDPMPPKLFAQLFNCSGLAFQVPSSFRFDLDGFLSSTMCQKKSMAVYSSSRDFETKRY